MVVLRNGPIVAAVDAAAGARIASLRVAGVELLIARDPSRDLLHWGCYPMVPFAGRVRGGRFGFRGVTYNVRRNFGYHSIHGSCYDQTWQVEHAERSYLRCSVDLGGEWPFAGRAIQEISLRPDGLDLRLEVHSDHEVFPAAAGWHPWWRRHLGVGHPLEVTLPARRWYPRGEDGLPTGRIEQPPFAASTFDDCFSSITWPVRLRWPGALELEMFATVDHVVAFDEWPDAVCVEPQSAPPDGLNLGHYTEVRPGAPLVIEAGMTVQPDLRDPRDGPSMLIERRLPTHLAADTPRLVSDRRRSLYY